MAIRAERRRLNDHVGRTTGGVYGVEILSEIVMTAIVTVFKIYRVLHSSTDRFENTVTQESAADLLDVLNRVLRLFALCKVSGDVTKEVGLRNCSHNRSDRRDFYIRTYLKDFPLYAYLPNMAKFTVIS